MALIVLLVITLVGCGQKPVTKSTQPQSKLPEIPNVSEKPKPESHDYPGQDFAKIPRYPNCQRVKFYTDWSVIYITYETEKSIQDVAKFYLSSSLSQAGWQIIENSTDKFDFEYDPQTAIFVSSKLEGKGYTIEISVWDKSNNPWAELKPAESTSSKNNEPNIDPELVSFIKNKPEIAGQDTINGFSCRPSNPNTVRISYKIDPEGKYLINYLTVTPYRKLIDEYISRGYKMTEAREGGTGLEITQVNITASILIEPNPEGSPYGITAVYSIIQTLKK